jgi:hypothetical protein
MAQTKSTPGKKEMGQARSPEPLDFFIWTVEVLICVSPPLLLTAIFSQISGFNFVCCCHVGFSLGELCRRFGNVESVILYSPFDDPLTLDFASALLWRNGV